MSYVQLADLTVAEASDLVVLSYIRVVVITFIVYDYFLTLRDEVYCIWMRPKTSNSHLFFLNRYLTLIGHLAELAGFFPLSNGQCSAFLIYRQVLLVVLQVTICAMMSIRVYLLWGRTRQMLWVLLGLNFGLLAIALFSMTSEGSRSPNRFKGCSLAMSDSGALHIAIGWMALLVYDVIIFSLLMAKTYKSFKESNYIKIKSSSSPLMTIVLRDGLLYFGAMVLSAVPNLLSYFVFPPLLRGSLSTFANSLASVIMSRIVFNLHEAADDIQKQDVLAVEDDETGLTRNEKRHYFTTMDFDDVDDYRRESQFVGRLTMV